MHGQRRHGPPVTNDLPNRAHPSRLFHLVEVEGEDLPLVETAVLQGSGAGSL
jgi:hypothetical protein